ncbi:hypothetical protein Y032_0107g3808 [Ancylostoma ceylanicum]|uniref:Uncharacterized protein n=1 Tax=Ancylostoma ceylanicum TaxID=53326 RepID=A0A016TFK7_9BILA|nr:hypothetical protein Y032_0107g3808 [Ancylostoma ceylanicum]
MSRKEKLKKKLSRPVQALRKWFAEALYGKNWNSREYRLSRKDKWIEIKLRTGTKVTENVEPMETKDFVTGELYKRTD